MVTEQQRFNVLRYSVYALSAENIKLVCLNYTEMADELGYEVVNKELIILLNFLYTAQTTKTGQFNMWTEKLDFLQNFNEQFI